jgi:hypothetical protein
MMTSSRGSAISSQVGGDGDVEPAGQLRPGDHGFTSATLTIDTVASPTNISRRARPPPAPTITILVTVA